MRRRSRRSRSPSSRAAMPNKLILPGDIQPYGRATVYSRVNGYLKSWDTDIGAHVKVNDALAPSEAPDLDQQLAQARATLASAKANYDIASLTAGRYSTLVEKQAISQQSADQSAADARKPPGRARYPGAPRPHPSRHSNAPNQG